MSLKKRRFTHRPQGSKKFNALILDSHQNIVFKMNSVVAPATWSSLAVNIVASKYFHQNKEKSVYELVERLSLGFKKALVLNHFSKQESEKIVIVLQEGLLNQKFSFNSPVWFNCGLYEAYKIKSSENETYALNFRTQKIEKINNIFERPQNSACFIQSVDDSLGSIFDLLKKEALLFKYGSGSGTNFSNLRSKYEKLKSGGLSSGLISFLDIFDKSAGSIKSGGVTRRAAKMICLDVSHPEIFEFINWKKNEEFKAQALIKSGYDGSLDGEVYKTISGQNSNNSVRVTDQFMEAVIKDSYYNLKFHSTGKFFKKVKAKDIWKALCESAWMCADPGIQFHTTINEMNTCAQSAEIRASNPCSEFMFLDNTACNLASLNLIKYFELNFKDEQFQDFVFDIDKIIKTQDALINYSSYPSAEIALNSVRFRPIGLGFANLGSLLMEQGIPYDSELGRSFASAITAAMMGQSYISSSLLAKQQGPFLEYKKNKKYCLNVFKKQLAQLKKVNWSLLPIEYEIKITQLWKEAAELIKKHGLRHSQLTLVAPTGTIGLVMDCGTTGIEPEYALVKSKKMTGGGYTTMVNPSVEKSLIKLGYNHNQIQNILQFILENKSVLNCETLNQEHLKIFQTAQGENCLSAKSHLLMMAAVQPFISGAISKTVNLPRECSVDDVSDVYLMAWKLKLKSVAVYRDQSKFVQPLNGDSKVKTLEVENEAELEKNIRAPLCVICGFKTVFDANCFKCTNCGHTTSCVG